MSLLALSTSETLGWIGLGALVLLGVGTALLVIRFGGLWLQAIASGARIGFVRLFAMSLRQIDVQQIVRARIMGAQAGLWIHDSADRPTALLEAHYLAKGDVMRVMKAIIAAQRAGITLDFDRAAAIDLAGRDVLEAVQTSVYPKVIDCPDPNYLKKDSLSAVSKDGIELLVHARVTVRTNLQQLVGGATEPTIIARVGEGIIKAIGEAISYVVVLETPDRISKAVLQRALDSNTAFEIVSIDIAHIAVGQNIGARLLADQAEADVRVARALAESRRAEAVADEQEMRALVSDRFAALTLAEATLPLAIATALRNGQMGGGAFELAAMANRY